MTRQDTLSPPHGSATRPGRPVRLLLESLAVVAVATLLVLVPSTAGTRGVAGGVSPAPGEGPGTALEMLAAREVGVQRARRLP